MLHVGGVICCLLGCLLGESRRVGSTCACPPCPRAGLTSYVSGRARLDFCLLCLMMDQALFLLILPHKH